MGLSPVVCRSTVCGACFFVAFQGRIVGQTVLARPDARPRGVPRALHVTLACSAGYEQLSPPLAKPEPPAGSSAAPLVGQRRGHHRVHVQREDRGADPPLEAGPLRSAARPGLQAAHRRSLRSHAHRQPPGHLGRRHRRRHQPEPGGARRARHPGRGHRRGAVLRSRDRRGLRAARQPGDPRHRRRARSGLPRAAVPADARPHGHRRGGHQGPRGVHRMRRAREPIAAPQHRGVDGARRRRGELRGPLPHLLRARDVPRTER